MLCRCRYAAKKVRPCWLDEEDEEGPAHNSARITGKVHHKDKVTSGGLGGLVKDQHIPSSTCFLSAINDRSRHRHIGVSGANLAALRFRCA
ncbi:hypothetical protein Trydic_g8172 [Trypoxylus dichotomus]